MAATTAALLIGNPKRNGTAKTNIKSDAKTSCNRLLDMMAGWADYADKDTKNGYKDAPGFNEKIHALYQEAGALGFNTNVNTDDEVREFVINRVLPVLTGK